MQASSCHIFFIGDEKYEQTKSKTTNLKNILVYPKTTLLKGKYYTRTETENEKHEIEANTKTKRTLKRKRK
jgi:hypothetical protein